ncbi:MAG: hypothetical protein MJ025_05305 [Victivallaceae bacterium]|nr:hypothetical protein [Victivallaceae bacterium]
MGNGILLVYNDGFEEFAAYLAERIDREQQSRREARADYVSLNVDRCSASDYKKMSPESGRTIIFIGDVDGAPVPSRDDTGYERYSIVCGRVGSSYVVKTGYHPELNFFNELWKTNVCNPASPFYRFGRNEYLAMLDELKASAPDAWTSFSKRDRDLPFGFWRFLARYFATLLVSGTCVCSGSLPTGALSEPAYIVFARQLYFLAVAKLCELYSSEWLDTNFQSM